MMKMMAAAAMLVTNNIESPIVSLKNNNRNIHFEGEKLMLF